MKPRLSHAQRLKRRRALAAAVRDGATCAQAARDFGVCRSTAINACRESGVRQVQPLRVLARLLRGEFPAEISRLEGISTRSVLAVQLEAERLGIAMPNVLPFASGIRRQA